MVDTAVSSSETVWLMGGRQVYILENHHRPKLAIPSPHAGVVTFFRLGFFFFFIFVPLVI